MTPYLLDLRREGFWSFEFHLEKGAAGNPSGRGGTRPSMTPGLLDLRWEGFWSFEFHLEKLFAGDNK